MVLEDDVFPPAVISSARRQEKGFWPERTARFKGAEEMRHRLSQGEGEVVMASSEIRRRYDRLSCLFDLLEAPFEVLLFRRYRRRLLPQARGRTLEVGFGTGRSLRYYPQGCRVVGLELSGGMLRRARRRAEKQAVTLIQGDAEHLPLRPALFDTVVCCLSLCTVPRPLEALLEMRRVSRPGGQISLLEHVLSPRPWIARLQHLLTPWQVRRIGCHLNRQTEETVRRAGISIEHQERSALGAIQLIQGKP